MATVNLLQENLQIKQNGTMPANYIEALIKLIPALVLGLFVALGGIIPVNSLPAAIVVAVIAVVATPMFLIFVSKITRVSQVVISTVSMLAYAVVTQPLITFIPEDSRWIPFVAVITWTVFAPLFYIKSSVTE